MQHHCLPIHIYIPPPGCLHFEPWKWPGFITASPAQKGHAGQEALMDMAPYITLYLSSSWYTWEPNEKGWLAIFCSLLFSSTQSGAFFPTQGEFTNSAFYTCFWTVVPSSCTFRDFYIAIYMYNAQLIAV